MKTINDLKYVTQIVKAILTYNERARNSDSILYLEVLNFYSEKAGTSLHTISVPYFLVHMDDMGFPSFETVRRTRQKIQATHPELSASENIRNFREKNEESFRSYAHLHIN